MFKTPQFRAEVAGKSHGLTSIQKNPIPAIWLEKNYEDMPLIRLLHAFATGAATFSLNPILPLVSQETMTSLKTSNEAFAEDAIKLSGDFQRSFVEATPLQ